MAATDAKILGLIAGEGEFPILVARGAKAAGLRVACASLGGFARPELAEVVDVNASVGLMRLGQWIRVLKRHHVTHAIMVGRVPKKTMYARGRIGRWLQFVPDARTISLYVRRLRHDKRDHKLLEAVADELQAAGITLIDSTTYTKDHLATAGVMTSREPTDRQRDDARFGFELCKTISKLDVGQSIALIDKDVIAVEAMEGTNAMIRRAGEWCRTKGWTFVKVSNARQDMRVDVPTVGVQTIELLKEAGCGCIALEIGQVMMIDKPKVLETAEKAGIAIVGFEVASA
jgi:UDP-2,3-diacylglucosamine hydrolase